MVIRAILILGAIMLTCGSAGLLLVRLTSPLLRGLGYMGAAFASGSVGSALLLGAGRLHPQISVTVADLCVLASFVLLHVAVLELAESESLLPRFGLCLLALQAIVDVSLLLAHGSGRTRSIAAGLLLGAQAVQTIVALFPLVKQRLRTPTLFIAGLLTVIALINFSRSTALLLGSFREPEQFYTVAAFTFASFLGIALGLGFGVFWMSTALLTEGLEQMAGTDSLTRTFNRRVFLRWCERERDRYVEKGALFSILMIDFDHFKVINDTYGHHTGDLALCSAVEHMQNAIRGIDVLGRWGGEEFAVLLPGATVDAAALVAERLRANVARMRLPVPAEKLQVYKEPISVTVSVGVATFSTSEDSVQHMLKRADIALYEAKAAGRNRVVIGAWPAEPPHWIPAPASF